jgi:hypothetical protein
MPMQREKKRRRTKVKSERAFLSTSLVSKERAIFMLHVPCYACSSKEDTSRA